MLLGCWGALSRLAAACWVPLLACGGRTGLEGGQLPAELAPEAPRQPDAPVLDAGAAGAPCSLPSPEELGSAPAPLLHYRFDDDARNTGTLGSHYDGTATLVGYEQGKIGSAISVGFPSWVDLPETAEVLKNADALTIALWIQPSFASSGFPIIDCRSFYDGFHTYHGVSAGRLLTTCYGTGHPANGPGGCRSFDLPTGDWHHLAYRYPSRGAPVEVHVDNELVATLETPSEFAMFGSGVNDIWLGNAHVGSGFDAGKHRIDDLRVYDRVLEPKEQCEWIIGGAFCERRCVLP